MPEKKMIDLFLTGNDKSGWKYSAVFDDITANTKEHGPFKTQKEALDDMVKVYRARRRVAFRIEVEMEDIHFDTEKLSDMIAGRASTIQGVDAMGTVHREEESWFEAEENGRIPT